MKRYRIIKREIIEYSPVEDNWDVETRQGRYLVAKSKPVYVVQKRFLGFLWWYNFNNIDGFITGEYDTIEEARKAIARERMGCHWNEEVVEEYD